MILRLASTLHFLSLILLTRPIQLTALNSDGISLLSFKYSVLSDPLSVLESWNYNDDTPCQWNGIQCTDLLVESSWSRRVTSLALPNSKLLGSIPTDFGMIDTLQQLDLSDNFLNGTLPLSLFNASQLRILSLANNEISGELPDAVGSLKSLEFLNLSDNALTGRIPDSLISLPNFTVLCLSNNYLYGNLPRGFGNLEVLDLSSNLLNGSLPTDLVDGGRNLRSLNLSYNRLSGGISPGFASGIPANASLDLSFNKLGGGIPEKGGFDYRRAESFAGNPDLCGKPLKNPCSIPSTLSTPPNSSTSTTPLAIAAIPKSLDKPKDGPPGARPGNVAETERGLKPGVIIGIIIGDLVGIGIVSVLGLYLYQSKRAKRKKMESEDKKTVEKSGNEESSPSNSPKIRWPCLSKQGTSSCSSNEEASESTGSEAEEQRSNQQPQQQERNGGALVMVDGEQELELETLLKASAYILGSAGPTIVYKAVLDDGSTFAVRRIGESYIDKLKDFENQVKIIAKLRHPNLVRLRGFHWGEDEKLVIYDYAPNGSLANASQKKTGSSLCNLSWEVRLRIARGVARGLTYLHEKKHVHGNLKPTNILLGPDMEPTISDFGLERLIFGDTTNKASGGSGQHFSSKQSMVSRDNLQDLPTRASASVSAWCASPYHAPESLKSLKPNPKWDVYSFGMVLLEIISGKVLSEKEITSQLNVGLVGEDRNRVLMMADVILRAELEGKEEALLMCFKLGFSCASLVPQKRPAMKEALQILDKLLS
ncbi:probable LRR receptor-like serine/threonine-protein kinase At4g37250 [Magnolia sinica]|uniref:probable LRR receptor-like serine/threonine-protein kinase At4g37250 n=1 Tax=Magnolia sinica TaxID=86752 RepID=UPI00265835F7|nr:probable LRR receptor-like serine/threonine-protein kinase At4g37250 [Magnolia sinica]